MNLLKRLIWLAQNLIACVIAGGLIWLWALAINAERYGVAAVLTVVLVAVGLVQRHEYRPPPEL